MKDDCSDSTDSSAMEDERKLSRGRMGANGRKSNILLARPNASAGYWLCCLLPLAFASRYLHESPCRADSSSSNNSTYGMLTIAATGMCIETLCFFMYLFLETNLILKLLISLIPGLLTSGLFTLLPDQTWRTGLFWGFAATFCYQSAYIRVMQRLPHCFSYGEASVIVQGLMLFVLNAVLRLPKALLNESLEVDDFTQLNLIMINALSCLLLACWLLALFSWLRKPVNFYALMVLLVVAVTCIPVTRPLPIISLLQFILKDIRRINVILFYLLLVGLTIVTVWWQLRNSQKASTSVRKIFHVLIVLVYVPGLLYQCAFLYIASGVALAFFTVLELFRILEIPPLAGVLKNAFASFSDEKDAGLLALTPFCLLIGCSLPIWIFSCPCGRVDVNENTNHLLPLMAGILAIGCGDTAASVIGSKFGRIKWRNSHRSLEGTLAFIFALLMGVIYLDVSGYMPLTYYQWLVTIGATIITALIEAHTDQIDNLVLPLVFYTIVNFV